jgi:hypothetical protein
MSCGSSQFSSAPAIATKAARKLVASIMEVLTKFPAALSLKSQFIDTGIANKDSNRFGGDISQFLNRVLGMSFDAQKWVLGLLEYHFDEIRAELWRKNKIDPETKGAYII